MIDRRWGRKIGFAPLLLNRHARRHFVEFGKVVRPEKFVKVEITVIALSGARIGAQEVEVRTVGQHNRVAAQIDVGRPSPLLGFSATDQALIRDALYAI
jgi:hypothetical protein